MCDFFSDVLNQCQECTDTVGDVTGSAGRIDMISEEEQHRKDKKISEKISAALLEKELHGDRDDSTDYAIKVIVCSYNYYKCLR